MVYDVISFDIIIDYTTVVTLRTERTDDCRVAGPDQGPRVERSFQACELGDVYKNYSVTDLIRKFTMRNEGWRGGSGWYC